ncbi:hypothetical protein COX64_03710 [Candidatus Dojkabacteria bacterium CG_4_10_14_0_2_um_filter_Dojkabacteria_WS6_41_15]|uniref:DNA-directed DNA polymerase n=1 Tax=Candidatus Dojkabacteria bacterium CG_4_10_14_0_2_um_filter_Dojkabacteria_WS6_41_15 TaxID=2014249 RepID=A0A2M7W1J7_9BACT|nr:MAG: hypothetical protein COX64_03710 [Candidatus Dojkabacteria bacterium CG_4_10_14_0_2_um_filter_Dojkabacteria_WS6_41_15]
MLTKGLLLAVDANSLLHRAYHAYPLSMTTTDGQPVNAVYGFASMFLDALLQYKPEYVYCAFDTKKPTFRHISYVGYKANRPETDSELVGQIPYVYDVLKSLNIPIFDIEGYEADDILGTVCAKVEAERFWPITQTYVLTGDRDLFQLVNERVQAVLPKGSFRNLEQYTEEKVYASMGVTPEHVPDLKGLMGDSSDNIPGVKGIGPKTASVLLNKYQTIEEIYEHIADVQVDNKRVAQLLIDGHESATMSKELATIAKDVPVTFSPEAAETRTFNPSDVSALFSKLQFKSLFPRLNRLVALTGNSEAQKNPAQLSMESPNKEEIVEKAAELGDQKTVEHSEISLLGKSFSERLQLLFSPPTKGKWRLCVYCNEVVYISEFAKNQAQSKQLSTISFGLYDMLTNSPKANESIVIKEDQLKVLLDIELLSYLLHTGRKDYSLQEDLLQAGMGNLPDELANNRAKVVELALYRMAVEFESAKLYLPLPRVLEIWDRTLDVAEWGGLIPYAFAMNEDLPVAIGVALMHQRGILIDIEKVTKRVEEYRGILARLEKEITEIVGFEFNVRSTKQLANVLFGNLGLPNARKTKTGFSTDDEVLQGLVASHPVVEKVLEHRQMAKIVSTYMEPYLELKFKGLKDKVQSTEVEQFNMFGSVKSEKLKDEGMKVEDVVPDVDVIGEDFLRVHSTFSIMGTTSGRLSSSNPNLQNLPVKTEVSKVVRGFFVPEPGKKLVSIDYSQIDLRVLAHISQDKGLIGAFQRDEDIHRSTAAKIFHVPYDKASKKQRQFSKTINFGLVYGMSSYGLSKSIGVDVREAAKFIEEYFEQFPKVKEYMNETVLFAREHGYVESLLGRRRYIAGIATNNKMRAQAAGREAINMPIQGGADDIMRLALGKISLLPEVLGGEVKLVLQVHDELVFEIKEDESTKARKQESSKAQTQESNKAEKQESSNAPKLERGNDMTAVIKKLTGIMESVLVLDVPLKAEAEVGESLEM